MPGDGLTFGSVPAPVQQDDGLDFADYIQPPDVPCDPVGDDWRGPPGPPGPPGADGGSYTLPIASTTVLGGVKIDGATITISGSGVISSVATAGVASFNTRTGAVTLTLADVTSVGGAPAASPTLTGTPTAPTASVGTATGQLATTAFVANQIAGGAVASWNGRQGGVTMTLSDVTSVGGAPIASPAFTGTPTVPTATAGTATVQAASTAFVTNAVSAVTSGVVSFNTRTGAVVLTNADVTTVLPPSATLPNMDGTAAIGAGTTWARSDHVHPSDTSRYAASNPSGYQTAAQVTTALAPYAPLASPALTGSPTVPTAAPGTATTQAASTAFVGAAVATQAQATPGQNYIDNSGFLVNLRGYVSGTALAAAAYGHDRWKAGAGGCTYTFAAPVGPATTITITAGTLQQIIEGGSVVGGNYRLSWTGTAQGRVGAGAYAASPVAVSGIAAGANTTIEFNAGTLGTVKFEPGTVATPWVAASARYEISNCQRFYQTQNFTIGFPAYVSGATQRISIPFVQMMRATPTVTVVAGTLTSATAPTLAVAFQTGAWVQTAATAAGGFVEAQGSFSASADL